MDQYSIQKVCSIHANHSYLIIRPYLPKPTQPLPTLQSIWPRLVRKETEVTQMKINDNSTSVQSSFGHHHWSLAYEPVNIFMPRTSDHFPLGVYHYHYFKSAIKVWQSREWRFKWELLRINLKEWIQSEKGVNKMGSTGLGKPEPGPGVSLHFTWETSQVVSEARIKWVLHTFFLSVRVVWMTCHQGMLGSSLLN